MKTLITIAVLVFVTNTYAYEAQHAKQLYDDAKCASCHIPSHFNSENRKTKNYKELDDAVQRCQYGNNVEWFEEEKDDVVRYLNDLYYKFDKK